MNIELTYKRFGSHAILIDWQQEIEYSILEDIIDFKHKIKTEKLQNLEDLVNGYNSLTLIFSTEIEHFEQLVIQLKAIYSKESKINKSESRLWQIPVCYNSEFGIDLQSLSENKNLSQEEVVKLHSEKKYKVYFIGFLPGFLYLGGLNEKLHIKRKTTPRLKVDKGSVAIGGSQTGIYPTDSAGGWHIIGKTPISFFDATKNEPCFARSGDQIQFVSISKSEFNNLETEVFNNTFELKPIANA